MWNDIDLRPAPALKFVALQFELRDDDREEIEHRGAFFVHLLRHLPLQVEMCAVQIQLPQRTEFSQWRALLAFPWLEIDIALCRLKHCQFQLSLSGGVKNNWGYQRSAMTKQRALYIRNHLILTSIRGVLCLEYRLMRFTCGDSFDE